MVDTDEADTAMVEFMNNNKHAQAMFTALKDSSRFLALPPATLKVLLLAQNGIDSGEVIAKEIKSFCDIYDSTKPFDRYQELLLWAWPAPEFLADVEFLGSLPGGVPRAVNLLVTKFSNPPFETCCKQYDDQLMKLLLPHMQGCARQKVFWDDPQLSITTSILDGKYWSIENIFDEEWPEGSFAQCVRLLDEWYLREYGRLVAQKVAGHLLPPELVELIGECFYNKRFLSLLSL